MKYKINFKANDSNVVTMKEVIKFMETKGYYPMSTGFDIELFTMYPNQSEDIVTDGIEVDIPNKVIYSAVHGYMHEQDIWEDYGDIVSIQDKDILEFFDKLGFDLHEQNKRETDESIDDWF